MDYKLTTALDRQQFYDLYLYAFNKTDSKARQDFFFYRYDHAITYGLKQNKQLISGLYALPLAVGLKNTTYTMHGIGDVMSAPEYSGQGGASTLLRYALEKMNQTGVALSYLAPFSFEYYHHFGYEHVFDKVFYRLAASDLKHFYIPTKTNGQIKKGPLKPFIKTIAPLYQASFLTKTAGLLRSKTWWHYLTLKNNWDVAVFYDKTNTAYGYLIYERAGMTLTIKELIYQTPQAKDALTNFIVKHQNSFENIIYEAPNSEYLGLFTANPALFEAKIVPYMMARIVNLESFLTKYPFRCDLELDFTLKDPVLKTNCATWHLKATKQNISLTKAKNSTLTLTIQQLSQIFLGATKATKLYDLGLIKATNRETLAKLDKALVHEKPSLIDFF